MYKENDHLILVVDDEADIRELIQYNLEKLGYKSIGASNGEDAIKQAREKKPTLIILDIMLPGIDGLDVCRILKDDSKTRHICIIMLTAKGAEAEIVRGLEVGADDYVTKPFSPSILMARVKANIRRNSSSKTLEGVIEYTNLYIHKGRRETLIDGEPIILTNTEFLILYLLASNPNWVFTRAKIIDAIRGDNYPVTDRSVDFQIMGLRKKMGKVGDFIKTVRSVGYRFIDDLDTQ
jgi:two-component system, OmpR family, alkaline phosphatase synthesis response regulator PhoP